MVLSRDLMTQSGDILLAKSHVLDEKIIEQIRGFERMGEQPLTLYIHANSKLTS
jgi:hypothetical protein